MKSHRKLGDIMKILIMLLFLLTSCGTKNDFSNQEIIEILNKEGYVTTVVEDDIVVSKQQKTLIIYFTENNEITSSSFYHSELYPDWVVLKEGEDTFVYDYNKDSLFDLKGKPIEGNGELNKDEIKLLSDIIKNYENFYYDNKYIKTNNITIKQIEEALLDYYVKNK